jgi:hypothetical protein
MKILFINLAFHPDFTSVGQHLTDLAVNLRVRGHEVSVVAGDHSYESPAEVYPRCKIYKGVKVQRVCYTSFGKQSKLGRFLDYLSFTAGSLIQVLRMPRQDCVVSMTLPPFIGLAAVLFCSLKGGSHIHWAMDINPDEAISLGWLNEKSLLARLAKKLSGWIYRHSDWIVTLDHFMKTRLE